MQVATATGGAAAAVRPVVLCIRRHVLGSAIRPRAVAPWQRPCFVIVTLLGFQLCAFSKTGNPRNLTKHGIE